MSRRDNPDFRQLQAIAACARADEDQAFIGTASDCDDE
jgi:hypothetical protein